MSKPVILSMNILTGHKVQNPAGKDLGKIDDLVLDDESGRVLYAVIAFGGFLGMGDRLIAVPWKRLRLKGDQKAFILNIDRETLSHAPAFDKERWPDMSLPEWKDSIDRYFAYKPADESQAFEGAEFIDFGSHSRSRGHEQQSEQQGLARRVELELYAAKAFDMSGIQVTAREGTVTLNGVVGSRAEFILADNIVRSVEGVRTLNNNLRVPKVA